MNASKNIRMTAAKLAWDGMPADPIEFAQECPHCGEYPEWERDRRRLFAWRLNCCGINDTAVGHDNDHEIDAVIAWNDAVEWEKEVIGWSEEAEAQAARETEEDAWVDANLPMVA